MADRNTVKRYSVSLTGAGTSDWITFDHAPTSHHYLINCVVTGTVNYDVEMTGDDPSNSPVALQHDIINGKTTSYSSTWDWPAQGARILINSGTGTVTMYITEGDG